MKARNINDKQQGGDRGTLGGAHRDLREIFGRTLEEEAAGPAREEGAGLGHKVRVDPFGT